MDFHREVDPTSQIAQERVHPGPPGLPFLAAVGALAATVFGLALALGLRPGTLTAGEAAGPGLVSLLGLAGGRAFAAFCSAVAAAALAVAGRRLLHSGFVGVLVGSLWALDPAFLAVSRLALPETVAVAGMVVALAAFLSPKPWAHWVGSAALSVAALADPRTLLWGIPLTLLILVRGHIYAAPRHLALAAGQALGMPAIGAVLHLLVTAGQLPAPCLDGSWRDALVLSQATDLGGGIAAAHNPATWFGGMGALLFLAGSGVAAMVRQFRLARLPGRIQMRISESIHPTAARALWLLALAVAVPFPAAWMPLFALALGAGIETLSEDAPGFGLAVAGVLVLFAVLGLGRAWGLVAGGADLSGPVGLVPWGNVVGCNT